MTKGASLGSEQYCRIRSKATMVFSRELTFQRSPDNAPLRLNPYVIATPAKPVTVYMFSLGVMRVSGIHEFRHIFGLYSPF